MIISVVRDLKVFLIFYFILIIMFSMVFNILNRNTSSEYSLLNTFTRNLLTVMRLSLGDFDSDFTLIDFFLFTEPPRDFYLQNILFWIVWVGMVIFSALIFLNFIIAEVSNSYEKVVEKIDELIYKERAGLINEAEDIMAEETKKNDK